MLVRVAGDAIMMSPTLIMTPGEVDEVRSVIHSIAIILSSVEYPCNIDRFAFQLVSIYGEALKATEARVAELKSKKN